MPLSGKEMLKIYLLAGWEILRQKGSHIQLKKGSLRQTIPLHNELKKGLEKKLLKDLEQE